MPGKRFLFIHKIVQIMSLLTTGFFIALVIRTDQSLLNLLNTPVFTKFEKTAVVLHVVRISILGAIVVGLSYTLYLLVTSYINDIQRVE
jgi:multisubunit Na+/H+ antiporter MnhC subunit